MSDTSGAGGLRPGVGTVMNLAIGSVMRPQTLDQALSTLAGTPGARVIAGGTDLVVQLRDGRRVANVVVDLTALQLAGISECSDGLEIGALTTMDEIARSAVVAAHWLALAAAAAQVGAWPIQCRATLGGNLANASPAADTAPALLAEGAMVRLQSLSGHREVSLEEFFIAPGRSALRHGELLTAVFVPRPVVPGGGRIVERFVKVGPRREQIISMVSMAGQAVVAADGRVERVRLAFGSVAPTPVRAVHAERALTGHVVDEAVRRATLVAAQADIVPIDDVRAPARYRRLAAATLLDRFLAEVAHA